MATGAAPLATPDGVEHRGATCRNCGAAAPGSFCPSCGQATALHPPTVREFVHEFITHSVALEGALWRTLVALLFVPGRLTADYFEGRRARYIAPLRLYLTASLVLFALTSFSGNDLKFGDQTIRFQTPNQTGDELVVSPRISDGDTTGIAFIDRALERVEKLTPAERSAHLQAGMKAWLPYVLIVLVPLLALYLKLLYRNRRRLYGEHLVVAFHAQTVAFIFAMLSAAPLGAVFGFVIQMLFLAQGAVALRRVYGGRVWPTLLRELVLFATYGVTVALAVGALATLSLLFIH